MIDLTPRNIVRNEYYPTSVSAPGGSIADILEERGISRQSFAASLGRSQQFVDELLKGEAPITRELALDLERTLGPRAYFWLGRERDYRRWLAEKEDAELRSKPAMQANRRRCKAMFYVWRISVDGEPMHKEGPYPLDEALEIAENETERIRRRHAVSLGGDPGAKGFAISQIYEP